MLQTQKSTSKPEPTSAAGSPRPVILRLLEGLSAVCARDLVGRLPSNTEKSAAAARLLKSGVLSEPAQETLVEVLAEHRSYQQHISVLDSGKLTSVAALDALKVRIRAFSDSAVIHSNSFSYHPRK